MSWIQLFKVKNFEEALKKRTKNGFHVQPILRGKRLGDVVSIFKQANLPFIWKEKAVLKENNPDSPLHKFPRGIVKKERAFYERVLKLRQGLAASKERELKWRQEYLNKRVYRGMNNIIKQAMPLALKASAYKPIDEFKVSGGGGRRKMVSEFTKDVPKFKSPAFHKRTTQKIKNLMEDQLLDANEIKNNQQKAKREEVLKKNAAKQTQKITKEKEKNDDDNK